MRTPRGRRSVDSVPAARSLCVAVVAAALAGWGAGPSLAAAGDAGYRGPSYGSASSPTGEKPEHKLWWNDGSWWADMWDPVTADHYIHRLDLATQTWSKTATRLDDRSSTKGDVLWDGNGLKLYVASHTYTSSAGASTGNSRLYRYGYSPGTQTYALDPGFPVTIADFKVEALTIAKDSAGTLWATWVQGGQTWVNRTLGSDLLWGTPFGLSTTSTTAPGSDDLSAVIAFGGDKVGVLWSDQKDADAFHFAVHADGAPDTAWAYELVAVPGPSDDHINLKTDAAGRIYAVVKRTTSASTRLVELLVRQPGGGWSGYPFGTAENDHTRPVVVLDEEHDAVFVFAGGPEPARSTTSTASIWRKGSFASSIVLPAGMGTLAIHEAGVFNTNNPTTAKQNVTSATGMLVLASNDSSDRYWHHYSPLVPEPANADFTAVNTSDVGPLDVVFQDLSTAGLFGPSSWSWDFGDGTTGTGPAPRHTYTAAGTYTVSLTVSEGGGSDTETKAGLVTVLPGLSVTPVADAYVKSSSATSKYGTATTLRLRLGTDTSPTTYRSFARFDVPAPTQPVQSVKLRLYVTDASKDGGTVALADNAWTESTVTWSTQPAIVGAPLATVAKTYTNTWVEWDVTAAVTAGGTYTFALTNGVTDGAYYSSREGAKKPQLRILYATP